MKNYFYSNSSLHVSYVSELITGFLSFYIVAKREMAPFDWLGTPGKAHTEPLCFIKSPTGHVVERENIYVK